MDKNAILNYTEWARNELTKLVEQKAFRYGIEENKIAPESDIINGKVLSSKEKKQRQILVNKINSVGYKNTIEEVVYTWFNRIIALRFMEVNGYFPSHIKVFSDSNNEFKPEILKEALSLDFKSIDKEVLFDLVSKKNDDSLFQYLVIAQCNELNSIIPDLFEKISNYTELLFPDNLLRKDSVIGKLITDIDENDFKEQVQIIGWFYQFYVAGNREEFRKAKSVTKDLIPTLTQVFTPDWIVRYMAENSLGRLWLESYPNSGLKKDMEYYIDDAKQIPEVEAIINNIKYKNVNPEELKIIEPCCGSGHILVYLFDLLYKMYEEKGYQTREIPTLILKNNLYGLEIDKRAAQLASFSLIMTARSYNPRFFEENYFRKPRVYEIIDSQELINSDYQRTLETFAFLSEKQVKDIENLVDLFKYAKTIGSLLIVKNINVKGIIETLDLINESAGSDLFSAGFVTNCIPYIKKLVNLTITLQRKYDVMITNPPYLGSGKIETKPKDYLLKNYPDSKTDLFSMFIDSDFVAKNGFKAIISPDTWLFIESYMKLRLKLLNNTCIENLCHLDLGAFDAMVRTVSLVIRNTKCENFIGNYYEVKENDFSKKICYEKTNKELKIIPSNRFCFNSDSKIISLFNNKKISDYGDCLKGLDTGENDKFFRYWFEVDRSRIGKDVKWHFLSKGGKFRKWYGNNYWVINWENGGKEVKGNGKANIRNETFYHKTGITWGDIANVFNGRFTDKQAIFDNSGPSFFPYKKEDIYYLLGYMNSSLFQCFLDIVCPTIHFNNGAVKTCPVINFDNATKVEISNLTKQNIETVQSVENYLEESFDFKCIPINSISLQASYEEFKSVQAKNRELLQNNEEEINKLIIEKTDTSNVVDFKVPDSNFNYCNWSEEEYIRRFIIYVVGIIFKRYSYKNGDSTAFGSLAEHDISLVMEEEYFSNDLANKFCDFLTYAFGKQNLQKNLNFIIQTTKPSEFTNSSIRRYFLKDFWKDVNEIFLNKPYYFYFDAGSKNSFKALVYMHNYQKDLLAKMRTEYVLPLQEKYRTKLDNLNSLSDSLNSVEKIRNNAQIRNIKDKIVELSIYEEKLHHYADQNIEVNLDDGFDVNNKKFGDLVKAVK